MKVVREFLPSIFNGSSVRVVDLSPASDPWLDAVPLGIIWDDPAEVADKIRTFWPRPDHAHLATQYIKKLRQLIDAGAADEPANTGNPWVVLGGPNGTTTLFSVLDHAAEFKQNEPAPVTPNALLSVEDRTRAITFDGKGDADHQR